MIIETHSSTLILIESSRIILEMGFLKYLWNTQLCN